MSKTAEEDNLENYKILSLSSRRNLWTSSSMIPNSKTLSKLFFEDC